MGTTMKAKRAKAPKAYWAGWEAGQDWAECYPREPLVFLPDWDSALLCSLRAPGMNAFSHLRGEMGLRKGFGRKAFLRAVQDYNRGVTDAVQTFQAPHRRRKEDR